MLIPLLEKSFSSAVTDILCRTAEHLQTDGQYLEKLAAEEFEKRWIAPTGKRKEGLQLAEWDKVPTALRSRILQQFWYCSGAQAELSGTNLNDLETLIERKTSGRKILQLASLVFL